MDKHADSGTKRKRAKAGGTEKQHPLGIQVLTTNTLVDQPPTLVYVRDDGVKVTEEQTRVGYVATPKDKRSYLEAHGIDMRWAWYDPARARWERCLFSEKVVTLLQELQAEGSFPYRFEAVLTRAEADRRDRRNRGDTQPRAVPFWHHLVPPGPSPGVA